MKQSRVTRPGKRKRRRKRIKRTKVEVQPYSYQPTVLEKESAVNLPCTATELARSVMRDVEVTHPKV